MPEPELDAAGIARVFNEHGVEYVVIGAYAAIAQKAPIPATRDIDFTPETGIENLNRLSRALKALDARIRTDAVEGGLQFSHDGASLGRSEMWDLVCDLGEFDIAFHPAAFQSGYAGLVERSHKVIVDGVPVTVADLDDVILSKETAGRPKDLRVLPILYRFSASKKAGDS
jgi:UDP:flavonoid glycosyltransferase YjiC (YdhE family)